MDRQDGTVLTSKLLMPRFVPEKNPFNTISVQKQEKLQNPLGTDAGHRTTLNTTGGGSLNTANVQKQENNKIPFVKKVTKQPFRCLEEREHCNRLCGFQIFKQCFLSKLFIT